MFLTKIMTTKITIVALVADVIRNSFGPLGIKMGPGHCNAGLVQLTLGEQLAQILFDARCDRPQEMHLKLDTATVLDVTRLSSIHQKHPFGNAQHAADVFYKFGPE